MGGIDTVAEGGIDFPVVGIDATPVILITNRAVDVQSIDVFEFAMFDGEILISHFRTPFADGLKSGVRSVLREDIAPTRRVFDCEDWKSGSEREHIYEKRSF